MFCHKQPGPKHRQSELLFASWGNDNQSFVATKDEQKNIFIRIFTYLHDTNSTRKYLDLINKFEPPHDKTNNVAVRPVKTRISLGICPVWSESLLSAWRKLGSWATHWAHSKDTEQTGRMPRLIWVFARHTCHFVGFVMRQLISPFPQDAMV